jgi:glycosyltransferase involved in cell wall biosynthesis
MSTPRITVLFPVYNAERYLTEAVDSVLRQTYSDFELILIDDGSSDKSLELEQIAAARDQRIVLTTGPHRGLSACLNVGLEIAKGDLIARMDSDDISSSNRFEQQVRFLDQSPECCAVGTQAVRIDPEGLPISVWRVPTGHEEIDAQHVDGKPGGIIHPTVMIRRSALKQIGGYRPQCDLAEDYDIFLRLAEIGRLANLSENLLRYRLHEKSVTLSRTKAQNEITKQVLIEAWRRRKLEGAVPLPKVLQTAPSADQLTWWWAHSAFTEGHFHTARKHAYRLLRKRPAEFRRWLLLGASCLGPVALLAKRFLPYRLGSLSGKEAT